MATGMWVVAAVYIAVCGLEPHMAISGWPLFQGKKRVLIHFGSKEETDAILVWGVVYAAWE